MSKKVQQIAAQLKHAIREFETLSYVDKSNVFTQLSEFGQVFQQIPDYQDLTKRFSLALEGTHDGVWDWNLKTNEVSYSDRWAQILGYDGADELDSTLDTWKNHVHPDDLEQALKNVERYLTDKSEYMDESIYRMTKKNGDIIYTAHRGKALYNRDGKAVRMVGTTRNVHERVKTENQLIEQNELVNSILNNSPQLIFVKDKRGNFLKVNQSTADLFGKRIDEVEQVHNSDLHKVEDELEGFDQVEKRVLKEMKPVTVEERFTDYKGKEHIFQTVKSPL